MEAKPRAEVMTPEFLLSMGSAVTAVWLTRLASRAERPVSPGLIRLW